MHNSWTFISNGGNDTIKQAYWIFKSYPLWIKIGNLFYKQAYLYEFLSYYGDSEGTKYTFLTAGPSIYVGNHTYLHRDPNSYRGTIKSSGDPIWITGALTYYVWASRYLYLCRGPCIKLWGLYVYRIMYVLEWLYFQRCEAIKTKITQEWAQKQFITRVPILFYFLHDISNP